MAGFFAVGYYLVTLFFSLVLYTLWIRISLRYFRISYLNPVSRMIHSLTDPLVKPLQGLFTTSKKSMPRYDWPAVALILCLEIIKFIVLGLLLYKTIMPASYIVLFTISDFFMYPCNLFFYIILIRVIMSWVNPGWKHPIGEVMKTVSHPILVFARNYVPDVSGYDISPLVVLLILKLITIFMTASLPVRLIY